MNGRNLFLFILLVWFVMMYLYAWQKIARSFEDYATVMLWTENACPCLNAILFVTLTPLGKFCKCQLFVLSKCWSFINGRCEGCCPGCWISFRRLLQHTVGACFYASSRAAVAVHETSENDTSAAKRMANGKTPACERSTAEDIVQNWDPSKLTSAVVVLEVASTHSDGWSGPFKELRNIVVTDLTNQLKCILVGAVDFETESEAFLARADINLGKETLAVDRGALFTSAGAMEQASTIIGQIEKAGSSLSDKCCDPVRPMLHNAAKQRVVWASAKSGYKPLQYALFCAGTLKALHIPEVKAAGKKYMAMRGLPPEWDIMKMCDDRYGAGRLLNKTKVSGMLMGLGTLPWTTGRAIQQMLDDTYKNKLTRDRKDGRVPDRLVLVAASAVQNEMNWVEYAQRRQEIGKNIALEPLTGNEKALPVTMKSSSVKSLPKLDPSVQEAWMWHGTSAAGAEGITNDDFRINLAGSGAGTLYGRGIYLAEMCSKSDEYTKEEGAEHYLLLCRCTLGRINYNDQTKPDPEQLESSCLTGKHHCVLGDREKIRGTYREFMVYDDDQVYPAYIVRYRRQYY
eukprot:TRINITY_DN22408_c0_g1_i1.p1 TRINITY_DN22408_c0_g1~~TRINITY_DN22408_c0_g1_i1.p1  ORF type:complete len:571 (+),score=100.13 TRINITY_DN22408_c0_g1_i1:75-1787(+)